MTNKQTLTKAEMIAELNRFMNDMLESTKVSIKSIKDEKTRDYVIHMFMDECMGVARFLWRTNYNTLADLGYYEDRITSEFSSLYE